MLGLVLLLQIQVEGLHEGESFRSIPIEEAKLDLWQVAVDSKCDVVCGRVVNAVTRQPIEGAVVESWTHELNTRAAGHEQFGSFTTGPDGIYYLPFAGCGRIMAEGFYTSTYSLPFDGVAELFEINPFLPESKLRFVNTDGQPIEGVQVRSTHTCPHDIYAVDALSDSEGIAELPNFGFQFNVPELRFRAPGYRGEEYYIGESSWMREVDGDIREVVLLRMEKPIQFQLLHPDGSIADGVPLQIYDEPNYHIVRTDQEGRVYVEDRFEMDSLYIGSFGKDEIQKNMPYLHAIPNREVSLRRGGDQWVEHAPNLATGVLRIPDFPSDANDANKGSMKFLLLHDDGWFKNLSAQELIDGVSFPAGKISFMGSSFNAWAADFDLDLELSKGQELVLQASHVLHPLASLPIVYDHYPQSLLFEYDGLTFKPSRDAPLYIVPGESLVARWFDGGADYYQSFTAEDLLELKGIALDPDKAERHPDPWAKDRETAVTLQYVDGLQLSDGLRISVQSNVSGETTGELIQGDPFQHLQYSGPAGSHFIAQLRLKGYLPSYLRGRFPNSLDSPLPEGGTRASASIGAAPPLPPMIRASSLELKSSKSISFPGGAELDWLDEFGPGPLGLTLILDGEFAYRLELMIKPGEDRIIDLDLLTQ